MVVIEMREAAYNKVFGLIDEVKELDKKKRMVMCELEDAVYDCYDQLKDEDHEDEEDQYEKDYNDLEKYDDPDKYEEMEMNYRRGRGYRRSQMRNMRMRHNDEYENDENLQTRGYRSRSAMYRRNRVKRYM